MPQLCLCLLLIGAVLTALALSGCGSSGEQPPGAKTLSFGLTDAGRDPHDAKAPAGPIVFAVENTDSSKVTELEVLGGSTILGEAENLSEGLSRSFSLPRGAQRSGHAQAGRKSTRLPRISRRSPP